MDGIKTVTVTSGNAQAGFAALVSSGSSNSTFTVVTDEKADQAELQDNVRAELANIPDAGKISVGTQQGGFGTSSTVDITLQRRHVVRPPGGQRRHGAGHERRSGHQRGGHQPGSQPKRCPGQGGPREGRGGRTERTTGGRPPRRHHQPRPGRDGADRNRRLPRADRRGHPLHQHRGRPQHPAAGADAPPWAASPPSSRWRSRSPLPPATDSGRRKSPSRRRAPTWAR